MLTYLTLILALSLDTFMAALSYEANKIKIPITSNLVISFICSLTLVISILFGNLLSNIIQPDILKWVSFLILFGIGIFKIFDSQVKKCLKNKSSKQVHFKIFNFKFILQIYADYPEADIDKSKSLSILEAISLALALSIDGLSAGLAFASNISYISLIFILGLFINIAFILLSKLFGYIFSKTHFDLSFIGGFLFIILALFRL